MKAIAAPLIAPPRSPDVAEPTELELELRLELLRLVRVIGAERGTAIRIVGEDATERTMAEEERRRAMPTGCGTLTPVVKCRVEPPQFPHLGARLADPCPCTGTPRGGATE